MSSERDLEDVIWGRKDWSRYVADLVECDSVEEHVLLERIELVKDSIGRQLRKAVEQNHSRLVEQAGALQGLDAAREVICSEMDHLYGNAERLSSRLSSTHDELEALGRRLERLYSLHRIVAGLNRCEKLLERLGSLSELVKRTEAICELEAVVARTSPLSDISRMREAISETIPRVTRDVRKNVMEQLRSSMQTLNAPMVLSCVRALHNLGCYDAEMKCLLDEEAKKLDAAFLNLGTNPGAATKSLPQLAADVQTTLEQFSLLGSEMATGICMRIANIIRVRVPDNAPYACRVVQHLTRMLSRTVAADVQPIRDAFEPLKRGLLSHALSNMFKAVNEAFEDPTAPTTLIEKVSGAIRQQMASVNWDIELSNEMEVNVGKVMELCAQKIEQILVLDDSALQVGEHISSVQALNYTLLNVAHSLSVLWPRFSEPLIRLMNSARDAIVRVAHISVCTIFLSLHDERLGSPSPYAKELYNYVIAFNQHVTLIEPFMLVDHTLHNFVTFVIEMFLLSATLMRPVGNAQLTLLSSDLLYIADALRLFNVDVPMLRHVQDIAAALLLTPSELIATSVMPFWAIVQLLISQCEPAILSPPESAGWTKLEYVKWFMAHTDVERLNFFKSLVDFYTLSVVSNNRTEFVCNYHYILEVLNAASGRSGALSLTATPSKE